MATAPASAARLAAKAPTVVLDCRFDLADPSAGEAAHEARHLPGARYVHLDRDLSGTKTGRNGRHPLPDRGDFAAWAGRMGIAPGVQVVAYDDQGGPYAARCWWLLRWLGHDVVAVLEPAGPFSQAAHAAVKLRRAAMRSPASVLYIPEAARWRPGAVVAVLDGGSESHGEVLRKAVAIAAASRQQLVVLEAISGSAGKAGLSSLLEAYALGPAHLLVRGLEADSPEALEHALHPIAQSLIILARGALGLDEEGELMRLAARHQVPVLALEPKAG